MRDFLSVYGHDLIFMGKQRGDDVGIELNSGLLFQVAEHLAHVPGALFLHFMYTIQFTLWRAVNRRRITAINHSYHPFPFMNFGSMCYTLYNGLDFNKGDANHEHIK